MRLDLKLALDQNLIKGKEANKMKKSQPPFKFEIIDPVSSRLRKTHGHWEINIFGNGYTDNIWDIITDTCFLAQVDRKYMAGTDIISPFDRLADCKEFMNHYQKSDFDLSNLKSICIDDFEGYIAVETSLYKGK
mgnify:CR=1 FL=1